MHVCTYVTVVYVPSWLGLYARTVSTPLIETPSYVTPTNRQKCYLASFKKRCSLCDVWCGPIGGVYARRARLQAKSRPISRVSVLTFFGSKLLLGDYAVLTSITREIRAQRLFKRFLIAVQGMSGMDYESEHVCLTMNRCAYGRPAQKSNTSQMTSTF